MHWNANDWSRDSWYQPAQYWSFQGGSILGSEIEDIVYENKAQNQLLNVGKHTKSCV